MRGNKVWACVALMVLAAKAGVCGAFEYRTGDLLFQTEGNSSFSAAISEATAGEDSLSFVHVAIAAVDPDGTVSVVEASPKEGVRISGLAEFLSDSPGAEKGAPGVVVKRLSITFPAEQAIENAKRHLGEPYDWYYLPDNGMQYCSELVYDSYIDGEGNRIFTAAPMNFHAPDGTMPQFWTDLYSRLGVEVPEGIPGTNPNGIAATPGLEEVFRYF